MPDKRSVFDDGKRLKVAATPSVALALYGRSWFSGHLTEIERATAACDQAGFQWRRETWEKPADNSCGHNTSSVNDLRNAAGFAGFIALAGRLLAEEPPAVDGHGTMK